MCLSVVFAGSLSVCREAICTQAAEIHEQCKLIRLHYYMTKFGGLQQAGLYKSLTYPLDIYVNLFLRTCVFAVYFTVI